MALCTGVRWPVMSGRGREGENVLEFGDADIVEELLRVDGHGGADVLQVGIQTRARQRVRGLVADILSRGHDEEAQFNRIIVLHVRGRHRLGPTINGRQT